MKSQSFWLVKKNKPKILFNDIKYKKNNKSVLVKTLYSGISKGTERLVADGKVHKSQFSIMRCPFQEGDFNFPIKYGYINVGQIIEGPSSIIGKTIFTLSPHQTIFEISIKNINFIKNNKVKKYLLTANMETAVNIFWDSQTNKKDKILIIGLGSVGLLTAYYFSLKGYKNLYVTDLNINKKKIAKKLKLNFINYTKADNLDCIINTTSSYNVLNNSFAKLNLDGKIIEASWYGNKMGKLGLGNEFHSKRLKIISSQVSNIPAHMKKKHNYKTRLKIAIDALSKDEIMILINSNSKFKNLENDYISILNNENIIIHAIKY
jgi:hypothetical protein